MKKKNLGSSTSFVHGKEKEVSCHDMRKYVWQKYDFLQNIRKKKKLIRSKSIRKTKHFISLTLSTCLQNNSQTRLYEDQGC